MNYSSKLIESAVEAFSRFSGVGKKSALRMVYQLAKFPREESKTILENLENLVDKLKECKNCFHFSDEELCLICKNQGRNKKLICLVESSKEVMKIESMGQYKGSYHVLGGTIQPIEGIGPEDLNISELLQRVEEDEVEEIIMALSPTIDGDTTSYYINKLLSDHPVVISTIARGVAFGGELEYVDELTLGRSIEARTIYDLD